MTAGCYPKLQSRNMAMGQQTQQQTQPRCDGRGTPVGSDGIRDGSLMNHVNMEQSPRGSRRESGSDFRLSLNMLYMHCISMGDLL
ncbi:unnamed protein product [Pleuronectes platessa]|uniref:Uncharacterized protein n=1 Tax=Pleuronectes platessa TaxID=8262 RepID=A0A9N7UG89_PLEPL|nr:unnamed protein product [Pleuronectes platessa]